MATLEKIRSKSVFLFIIIIVALLAFIMGDFLNSGRSFFGPGTTIAQAGGHKIDYTAYQNRVSELSEQQQGQQQRRQDNDELAQQAIQSLIFESLVKDQMDKLGINVTDSEISRAMTGDTPHPAAQQFIYTACRYLNLPEANGKVLLDAITNPGRYSMTNEQLDYIAQQAFGQPSMKAAWAQQENALEEAIRQQAFGNLISGLFTASELDAQASYDDNMTSSVLAYVAAPLNTVPDDQAEVSDADLKAKWEQLKPQFKLNEETRNVDYVVVNIVPSAEDYNEAEVEVDKAVEALQAQEGLEGIIGQTKFTHDTYTTPVKQLKQNPEMRMIPDSALVAGGVYKFPLRSNTFTIAKVLDRKTQIDSLNVSAVMFPTAQAADSVMNLIANGTSFKDVLAAHTDASTDSVWVTLVSSTNSVNFPEEVKAMFATQELGKPFMYADSLQGPGALIYKVNKRPAAVDVATVAVVKYVVDPSNQTVTDLKTKLNSFLASNSKGDAFSANADSLYTLLHAQVTPSSPHIGNVPDSRKAVKWAMKAKPGQVSKVFDNNDYYMVVAVKEVYDGEYIPYNAPEIQDQLTAQARADKKAAILIDKYSGKAKDLAGYAALMNAEVQTDSAVVFTSPRLANLGFNEYALQGQVASAKPGQLVGPVAGTAEVVVFQVSDTKKDGRPYNFQQDAQSFMQNFAIRNYYEMLLGNNKVKNNSLEFIQD